MRDLSDFMKTMNKKYGAGSLVQLGSKPTRDYGVNVIPTGSLKLDMATGVGGYPMGRIIELIGNPMSGKTTLALHAVAQAQRADMDALYIDAEHALDVFYADSIGVDTQKMVLNQPDYGEQALQIVEEAARSGQFGIIVVDSVASLVPKRELDGEIGDAQVGLLARMMSQFCRKLGAVIHKQNVVMIFINQFRANISTTGYGGPAKVPTGGKALDYYASMILDIAKIQSLKTGSESVGNRTKVTIKKNKVAAPYTEAEFDIVYGIGVDRIGELVELGEEFGYIQKAGSWYKDENGDSLVQGKIKMIQYIEEYDEYRENLKNRVAERISTRFANQSVGDEEAVAGAEGGI